MSVHGLDVFGEPFAFGLKAAGGVKRPDDQRSPLFETAEDLVGDAVDRAFGAADVAQPRKDVLPQVKNIIAVGAIDSVARCTSIFARFATAPPEVSAASAVGLAATPDGGVTAVESVGANVPAAASTGLSAV